MMSYNKALRVTIIFTQPATNSLEELPVDLVDVDDSVGAAGVDVVVGRDDVEDGAVAPRVRPQEVARLGVEATHHAVAAAGDH